MKFKDIKVNDIVYVKNTINIGWKYRKSFYLPGKVTKVTNTQFQITNGDKYRKEDGRKIGDKYYYAYNKGDIDRSSFVDKTVKDETKEYNEFKQKISLERQLRLDLESLCINSNSHLTIPELKGIKSLLNIIKKALNNEI